MREINKLNDKLLSTEFRRTTNQSSHRDVKSLESSEYQQDKKLTSFYKRSVELQVRRENGDGDHESEDLGKGTEQSIAHRRSYKC